MNKKHTTVVMIFMLFVITMTDVLALPADDFVITIQTDNLGDSSNTSIELPFTGGLYDVDWDNDGTFDDLAESFTYTHDYGVAGTYTLRVRGSFGGLNFNGVGDVRKLIELSQWGNNTWPTMYRLFLLATNLTITASDSPNLSAGPSLEEMFFGADLANPDTSGWNTTAVTNMAGMFKSADIANPDVSNWNVAAVISMSQMFLSAPMADPDVSAWITFALEDSSEMFRFATVASPAVGNWDVSSLLDATNMFSNIDSSLYDSILTSWAIQSLQPNVSFGAGTSNYCTNLAKNSRDNITLSYNWTISDGGRACTAVEDAFITTWNTFLVVDSPTLISIPMIGGPYDVDWNNDGVYDQTINSGSASHLYPAGVFTATVRIRGGFDTIRFANAGDRNLILSVDQWGTNAWTSFQNAFWGAENLEILATDTPDLSQLTSLQRMFMGAFNVNPDVSNWDTSTVTNMASMFRSASSANPNLELWDTSAVTGMAVMFGNASSFNRDLSTWSIPLVNNMLSMFDGSGLSPGNYDQILIAWQAQTHQTSVGLGALNTTYCSVAASTARTNLINISNWAISDDGPGCQPAAPPSVDLATVSDTGKFDSDNITFDNTPDLEVVCSSADDQILLYTNQPSPQTPLQIYNCSSSTTETVTLNTPLTDNTHAIQYSRRLSGAISNPSPALAITIDTQPPAGPGSLGLPTAPFRDETTTLSGTCGVDAGSGTVKISSTPANGFIGSYNSEIGLFLGGEVSISNPVWNDGSWEINFECSDIAGNTSMLGPFGPLIADTICFDTDLLTQADFLPQNEIQLCGGNNSLTTGPNLTVRNGAITYFQSPETTLGNGFTVEAGAVFSSSPAIGNSPPHIFGPEQILATIGDTVVYSDTQSCKDIEDGNLLISPASSGILAGPAGSEFFIIGCIDSGVETAMKVLEIIKN
ncbi:MAG: BspA family leucine-rich repeat surface protein [Xanthomonadales bacterium]|nr:BspA family leucine-rich repeat surface protein [Xanthomonadales bacterium]